MTLIELIDLGSARLDAAQVAFGHGTDNAFDEASWLVLWRLGLPLDTPLDGLESLADTPVQPQDQARVTALFDQRIATRKPAAYLTGEAWLQGVPFYVDQRAIVPRSFIAELLAMDAIDPWLAPEATRVLDLCTGNGSLAVLAALAYPELHIDAADIDADALAVARINVERHGLQQRIDLLLSDGWSALAQRYDLVLCNPPYVNSASMAQLPPEYRAEPTLALAGGTHGMDFIRRMLRGAAQHLQAGAALVLEIGHERDHFEAAFPRLELVWLQTSAGPDQVVLITREALLAGAA